MKWLKRFSPILIPVVIVAGVIGYVAWRTRRIPTPDRRWKRFDHPEAHPLTAFMCQAMQGLYTVKSGHHFFGNNAVLKYSYVVENNQTIHHLSLFFEKEGLYMLAEVRQRGRDILLKGHWRRAAANGTGLIWLVMKNGVRAVRYRRPNKPLGLYGTFGHGNHRPRRPISLLLQEPLPEVPDFDIFAHRGGSRNVDFLSISENTTGIVKLAAQLGANGIEIDVRMTKDKVPVIFHDSFFSIHTVQNLVYGGLLHNYTLEEVKKLELRNGGRIPTLEEMLYTVLYQTPLELVWLDIKKECDLDLIHRLQNEYHQRAAAINRKLRIYIGIPDEYVLNCFKTLENYKEVPSLIELSCELALEIDAEVWAPQYTGGYQPDKVAKIHEAGKKAYVWSLDTGIMVEAYVSEGKYDGLVTNTAPVVSYWLYTKHRKEPAKKPKPVPLLFLMAALSSVF
jgi:glycerophosphoryl diester phosphodiesterase